MNASWLVCYRSGQDIVYEITQSNAHCILILIILKNKEQDLRGNASFGNISTYVYYFHSLYLQLGMRKSSGADSMFCLTFSDISYTIIKVHMWGPAGWASLFTLFTPGQKPHNTKGYLVQIKIKVRVCLDILVSSEFGMIIIFQTSSTCY